MREKSYLEKGKMQNGGVCIVSYLVFQWYYFDVSIQQVFHLQLRSNAVQFYCNKTNFLNTKM
jgi:hypothetical protein